MKKLVFLLLTLSFMSAPLVFAASVPTMNKDELKSLLGSDSLVILDVRTGNSWQPEWRAAVTSKSISEVP